MQDSSRKSVNNLCPAGITFPNEVAGISSISADCEANAPSHADNRLKEGRTWRTKVRERQS